MINSQLSSAAVARLAGGEPLALTPLGGGRNSQVFRLEARNGQTYALKAYFRHPGDSRDRLGVEFGALGFLWEQGLRCVPRPVASDPEASLGLFEYVQGEPPARPGEAEVDAACAFLSELHRLCPAPGAHPLSAASEACFSFRAIAENVELRLTRLLAVEATLAEDSGLASFLEERLLPAWRHILMDCREASLRSGLSFDQEIPEAERTLSPSDFGFHNALRRNGELVFLDFEYFGWDDPAKMLADFLLHPGMDLDRSLRQRFAERLLDALAIDTLRRRARLAFPLFGLKWCTILLNEFLPGPLGRRTFADRTPLSPQERQARQLAKTRIKLQQVMDDHANFPYFLE